VPLREAAQPACLRVIEAVANRRTIILSHMTGRQLLPLPGDESDVERVLGACAKHGVAVEINGPDWRWHRRALEMGCMMGINPDAHSTTETDDAHYGKHQPRAAVCQIANCKGCRRGVGRN
jgi:DNA polymerase (family 10)